MKLLHIIGTVNEESGGPLQGILSSRYALKSLGVDVEVVSLDSPVDSWVRSCPVPVFAMGTHSQWLSRQSRWPPWRRYGYSSKLVPWLRDNAKNYDAVIVNGLWNYCNLAAVRALRGAGTPYFVFTHGQLDPWFRRTYPIKHLLKQLAWLLIEGPLLAGASAVLFTSEDERRLARNEFWPNGRREFVVPFGIADVPPITLEQEAAFRHSLPSLGSRRFLLFLSRIHRKKGCDVLLKAFSRVVSEELVDLVMAGPDQDGLTLELKALASKLGISDRVHWCGMVSGPQKWAAFAACEAFVLSSRSENFGVAIVEALACQKPVLITNKVNIWREIEAGGGGLVCNDDEESVEKMLTQFFSLDTKSRHVMQQNARRTFLRHFEITQTSRQLLETLDGFRRS